MYVWIKSSHCSMADILWNVRQAKCLFNTIFVGTNSDCDVVNALCSKAMITWKFFSYVFWQWDQDHYLFQIQSDLFVRTPINQNPRYPKQIARSRFFPTHFTPLTGNLAYPLYTALSDSRWLGNPINHPSTTTGVSPSCLSAHFFNHTRFSESNWQR